VTWQWAAHWQARQLPRAGDRMRVLLAEDHEQLADVLALWLRRDGMAVDVAAHGGEAWFKLLSACPARTAAGSSPGPSGAPKPSCGRRNARVRGLSQITAAVLSSC
jgi:hypothetical protein